MLFLDKNLELSTAAANCPVKNSLEVKGVTTPTLALAAAKLFKGVNFLSYSGVRHVKERRSKSETENILC